MNRLGLIATLFLIAFVFTQCRDKCNHSCCGESFTTPSQPIGFTSITTEFAEDNWQPTIIMAPNFTFAKVDRPFSLFTSAYACSPPAWIISLDHLIDSIKIISKPSFFSSDLEEKLEFTNYQSDRFSLADFNSGIERNLDRSSGKDYLFTLDAKPTQSDSFTFSFYYYKDGAIIDSSSTQKFYISNE